MTKLIYLSINLITTSTCNERLTSFNHFHRNVHALYINENMDTTFIYDGIPGIYRTSFPRAKDNAFRSSEVQLF